MNRIAVLFCAVLLIGMAGCRHAVRKPVSFAKIDSPGVYLSRPGFPTIAGRNSDPIQPVSPTPIPAHVMPRPLVAAEVVAAPTGPPATWPLTLREALDIAFQHSDVARTLSGGQVQVDPTTTYDPAVARERVAAALAAFDVSFEANFYWNRYHQPPDSFFGPGISQEDRRDVSTLSGGLQKKWITGATTRVYYAPSTGYLFFPNGTSGLNPLHSGSVEISVRQPLLQGAGVEVNRAPIVLTQLKTDQSAWDYKRTLLSFVRSVEEAYWELQAAHVAQQVLDEQLPLIREVVRVEEAALAANRGVDADVAKSQVQLDGLLRRQAAAAATVKRNELRLRSLIGIESEDGRRIRPASSGTRARLVVDPAAAVNNMLNLHPILLRQRTAVQIREVELTLARNGLRPKFDVYALYRENGLSDQLDQALRMMIGGDYQDWEFGAVFAMPLGRHEARANLRAAELQLERERALLRETAQVSIAQMGETLNELRSLHEQFSHAESQLQKTDRWLRGARVRYQNPPPAGEGRNWLLLALDDYLLAMRTAADTATDVGQLLARYNTEIARLREREGTLLAVSNIQLATDPCGPHGP